MLGRQVNVAAQKFADFNLFEECFVHHLFQVVIVFAWLYLNGLF